MDDAVLMKSSLKKSSFYVNLGGIAESSNGRTSPSEGEYLGSSPGSAAK